MKIKTTSIQSRKVRTVCPKCSYTYEDNYVDKFTTTKCPECHLVFSIDSDGRVVKTNVFYRKYKNVVAFGKDPKTGLEVGIDDQGKHISIEETRYDFRKDPHGWQATGKKVKGKQKA